MSTSTDAFPDTIPALVNWAADRYDSADALADDERVVSFVELAEQVRRVAGALVNSGVAPGTRVAVWAPNSVDWAMAALGVYAAGGVLVPINTRFKPAEARHVLERSGAEIVFTVSRFLDIDFLSMLNQAQPLSHVRDVITLGRDDESRGATSWSRFMDRADAGSVAEAARRGSRLGPDDLCDVIFTSGTTGLPKGVMLQHGPSIGAYEAWTGELGLRTGDRFLVVFPFFQTSGLKAGIVACLLRGATNVPQPVFDVIEVSRRIVQHNITVLPGPPTAFRMLLDAAAGGADLSTLRLAVTGGATTPVSLVEEMQRYLATDGVVTAYGLTETTGLVSMCRAGDTAELIATSVGRAVAGVEVRAIDDTGADVGAGEAGELIVRGYNVMAGYLDDPGATAAAIDPDGWLHTGDVGTIDDDGIIHITDRLKDMFIVGGFNVYPAEVEAALLAHPGVAQVAVVGRPEPRLGEVGAAFVVRAQGHDDLTGDQLHGWCREVMSNYKVPRSYHFVDVLPLNPNGKVLKYQLREIAAQD